MNVEISSEVPLYAVMGNPIAHSLSPIIHQLFAQQFGLSIQYHKILVTESLFEQEVKDFFHRGGKGLNITLPFKTRAFAMADIQSLRSLEAEAANTLWMDNGKLYADNTDGVGLIQDLSHHQVQLKNKTILLVGAGGAARGIVAALLNDKPANLTMTNRSFEKLAPFQEKYPTILTCKLEKLTGHYDVIINATAASLTANQVYLPQTILAAHPFCYDLAYGKKGITPFVAWAKKGGCQAIDGIGMLIEQAAEAFFIWHGMMPNTSGLGLDSTAC